MSFCKRLIMPLFVIMKLNDALDEMAKVGGNGKPVPFELKWWSREGILQEAIGVTMKQNRPNKQRTRKVNIPSEGIKTIHIDLIHSVNGSSNIYD